MQSQTEDVRRSMVDAVDASISIYENMIETSHFGWQQYARLEIEKLQRFKAENLGTIPMGFVPPPPPPPPPRRIEPSQRPKIPVKKELTFEEEMQAALDFNPLLDLQRAKSVLQ